MAINQRLGASDGLREWKARTPAGPVTCKLVPQSLFLVPSSVNEEDYSFGFRFYNPDAMIAIADLLTERVVLRRIGARWRSLFP